MLINGRHFIFKVRESFSPKSIVTEYFLVKDYFDRWLAAASTTFPDVNDIPTANEQAKQLATPGGKDVIIHSMT
jgi:hypothetical protein